MVKVLITGGAGYLGSTTASVLLENGYKVTALDNLMYKQTSLLYLCSNKNFNFIQQDVTDFKLLVETIKDYDIIIVSYTFLTNKKYFEYCDAGNYENGKTDIIQKGVDLSFDYRNDNITFISLLKQQIKKIYY